MSSKVAKFVNLMMSTQSEGEALQCWRSARNIQPEGKLADHIDPGRPTPVAFDLMGDWDRQEREDTNQRVRANRAKREELKLRERELKIQEREEALVQAQKFRAVREELSRAERELADLISKIRMVAEGSPHWSDRQIAKHLKISPTTVGKYRKR